MESREYAVLKNATIKPNPAGDNTVEILCDEPDARLLLNRAMALYTEALPYIHLGLGNCA